MIIILLLIIVLLLICLVWELSGMVERPGETDENAKDRDHD